MEAATKQVAFHQNIGAVFARFSESVEGRLCKGCIHRHFWRMTMTTLFGGWWGTISFLVTPFFLLHNVARYVCCLGMPSVPRDALPPELTEIAIKRINRHVEDLFDRLDAGEEFTAVAVSIAERAGVTPGQVVLYVRAAVQAHEEEQRDPGT